MKAAPKKDGGGPRRGVPKYTIRLILVWFVPVLSLLMGCAVLTPFVLAAILTPIEVPKVRQYIFEKLLGVRKVQVKGRLPCLKVPALMRLLVLWVLQIWWLLLWREVGIASSPGARGADVADEGGGTFGSSAEEAASAGDELPVLGDDGLPSSELAWSPQTLSVVLPCAGEGEYALNTVRSVFETIPEKALAEIIVVDDGSHPPLEVSHLTEEVRRKYRVKVIRHRTTVGLIGAKKDGGDAARGDIVVFFDCHVAPQPGWHKSFLSLVGENYRRVVTPVITDLDVGTWKQRGGNHGQAKCYLTWDADFKWFTSEDPYVPVLAGGLLAISKRWWNETGGYDDQMVGWGGENLDQSLRTWLCGGEIVMAKDAFVAHMWRKPEDPRTRARYSVKANAANKNRMRAASAWFGEFAEKLNSFPLSVDPSWRKAVHMGSRSNEPWYGDLENILAVKRRLKCKSFAWFMHRFKNVYEDGGLLPSETFNLRTGDSCLEFRGKAGTSADGKGFATLNRCSSESDRQRWHGANRDTSQPGQPCCSGIRAWNTDQCITGVDDRGRLKTAVCDIAGSRADQAWQLDGGNLAGPKSSGFMSSQKCVVPAHSGKLEVRGCGSADSGQWAKDSPAEPVETRLYRQHLGGGGD